MSKLILSIAFIFSTQIFAADFVLDKKGKCKFYLSPSEAKLTPHWHGPCLNGFADGVGVARYLKGAKVESVFYGLVKRGEWNQGVHALNDGYIAGKFEKNQLVKSVDVNGVDDRNVIIKSFEMADKAALQISKEYEKAGNKASAKYYKAEAEKLAQQMD